MEDTEKWKDKTIKARPYVPPAQKHTSVTMMLDFPSMFFPVPGICDGCEQRDSFFAFTALLRYHRYTKSHTYLMCGI